jgi:hypothetical protein
LGKLTLKRPHLNKRKLVVTIALLLLLTSTAQIRFLAAASTSYIYFDFDNSTPTLVNGQGTPLTQASEPVTANFSSPSDPAAFSIQSYSTTFITLLKFSGKYLYDNNPTRDILDIKFNTAIVAINFTFATVEYHGGPNSEASAITLIAYQDSALVGSTTARGNFTTSSYPEGTLSYNPGKSFNWVRISLPAQPSGATDFLIDTVIVTIIDSTSPTPTSSSNPTQSPTSTSTSPSPSTVPSYSLTPSPSDPSQSSLPSAGTGGTPSVSSSTTPQVPEFSALMILSLLLFATVLVICLAKLQFPKTRS